MRILIVDDDRALAQLLRRSLQQPGADITVAHSVAEALEALSRGAPGLLVLDLELEPPKLEHPQHSGTAYPPGLRLLEQVRSTAPLCPVLVLSAAADTAMRVRCLTVGADDCLRKPFSMAELRARAGALLRRRELEHALAEQSIALSGQTAVLCEGALTLDRLRRSAAVSDLPLRLTGRECLLLEQLLLARGGVVSRTWMRELFGQGAQSGANVVDVHAGALRRKLSAAGGPCIESVRGEGYRLAAAGAMAARLPGLAGSAQCQLA